MDYEVEDSEENYFQRKWDVTAESDALLYYMKPEITSIRGGVDMPTSGGSIVTIKGKNFGEKGLGSSVLSVEFGPTPDSCSCACPWRGMGTERTRECKSEDKNERMTQCASEPLTEYKAGSCKISVCRRKCLC